jgi:hypothetical protein
MQIQENLCRHRPYLDPNSGSMHVHIEGVYLARYAQLQKGHIVFPRPEVTATASTCFY